MILEGGHLAQAGGHAGVGHGLQGPAGSAVGRAWGMKGATESRTAEQEQMKTGVAETEGQWEGQAWRCLQEGGRGAVWGAPAGCQPGLTERVWVEGSTASVGGGAGHQASSFREGQASGFAPSATGSHAPPRAEARDERV